MSEDCTQALVVPEQNVIYPAMALHNQHIDFRAGISGARFVVPDQQDCDYHIINYEELEKLLPDPKPSGRAELGLLPDGSAYAPKTASKDNFLLFPSKSSYILYFTHHYFSRENLNRDHTFLSMLIDKLVLPIEKLVKAPRLAALNTTIEDVEQALTKSKIVCLEDLDSGIRGVRRIDGYPASLLPEEGLPGSIHHSGPPTVLMNTVGCFTKPFLGPQFARPIDDDIQQFITSSDVHGNCGSIPSSISLPTPISIGGSTTMMPSAAGHLIRVPSGQPNQSQGISGYIPSLSSGTNTTLSDNQPIVTSLPNPNIINSSTLRPNMAGTWPYQPQSLFVVGPPYNRQSVSQMPTIGAMADNTALLYGLSHPHQASSFWGMRARYPYPPSQPYNGSIPLPVPSGDSHQITSGLPVRPPTAGHFQHYLFGQSNPPNAYPSSLPIYPINPTLNPMNLTMANAFAGQPTNHHRPQTQAPIPTQYATNPFFAGNAGHFASATAGSLNAHPSNVNFTNSYISMALATMAAASQQQQQQQQHQTAVAAATGYFHPPIGISPQNPYQGNTTSPVPIVYAAAQSQLPLQLARHHPRLPPPSQVNTVYALSTPYHLPQTAAAGNPAVIPSTAPATDLCGSQTASDSRTPDSSTTNLSSTANYTTNSSSSGALFCHQPASGSSSQTTVVGSSPLQIQQQMTTTTVGSPTPSSLHSSGQISNFHSITSIPNLVASSLAAAASGLNIQYPPARPSAVGTTNPFGGTPFTLNTPSSMLPTSYCGSPLQAANSGSSGVGSKSDTPNVDVKPDDLDGPKQTQQDAGYVQSAMARSQSAIPLANDTNVPSDETSVDVQQLPETDGPLGGGGHVERNLAVATDEINKSLDDLTDDSASSGIGEMGSNFINGGPNAGETNARSHPDGDSSNCEIQERRQTNKNNYVFVSCRRRQRQQHQQVIPVKESNFEG